MSHYWRPYTRGQWIWTDYGWFWDSQEPFGWATYHYGRWVNDRYYGWVWIPGTEWGPAWVSWRYGNGYTGWAPLPPRATWQTRVGLSIGGLDIDAFIGARDYCFVRNRSFVDRSIHQRILPPTQNLAIINVTDNVTRYEVVNDRVVDNGIAPENIERAVGRRLRRARAVEVDRFNAPRRARADEVAVFRPAIRPGGGHRPKRGHSLVQGEAPPAVLVERRRVREQERKREGQQAEVTAKEVEQRRPKGRAEGRRQDDRRPDDANARQQAAQQRAQQEQAAQQQRQHQREQAEQQRAAQLEQQRQERERRQAAAAQQQRDQDRRAQQQQQREQARQQAQQQQREQARQQAEQQRQERERRQAAERQQRDQRRNDPNNKQDQGNKGRKKPKAPPTPPPDQEAEQ